MAKTGSRWLFAPKEAILKTSTSAEEPTASVAPPLLAVPEVSVVVDPSNVHSEGVPAAHAR